MDESVAQQLGLPPIDQIGFAVADMEAALALYEPLFGPFMLLDVPITGADFRGVPTDCHLQVALGKSGDLEIELIAVLSGNSPHREFVEANGSGMHHLRYRVEDHDTAIAAAEKLGIKRIWTHQFSEEIVFSYLERAGDSVTYELLQMP